MSRTLGSTRSSALAGRSNSPLCRRFLSPVIAEQDTKNWSMTLLDVPKTASGWETFPGGQACPVQWVTFAMRSNPFTRSRTVIPHNIWIPYFFCSSSVNNVHVLTLCSVSKHCLSCRILLQTAEVASMTP
jgi:hypothetical protein